MVSSTVLTPLKVSKEFSFNLYNYNFLFLLNLRINKNNAFSLKFLDHFFNFIINKTF